MGSGATSRRRRSAGTRPSSLLEERQKEMLGLHCGVLQLLRRLLRGGQRLLGAFCESVQSHGVLNTPTCGRLTFAPCA